MTIEDNTPATDDSTATTDAVENLETDLPMDGEEGNEEASQASDNTAEDASADPDAVVDKVELTEEQQKAFNKTYFEAKQKEREVEALRKEIEALKASKSTPATAAEAPKTLEDFDFDDQAYQDYVIDQKVQSALLALKTKEQATIQQQTAQTAQQELANTFNAKAAEFAAANPTYNDVIAEYGDKVQYAQHINEIVLESGPELDFYLLQNPALVDELNSLSPMKAGMKLASYADKIAKAPVKQKQVSQAPTPPPTGSGGGRATRAASDSDSMKDYYAKEMQRLEAKHNGGQ